MTYSIKDKNMINTNRAVVVHFPSDTTNGSADIMCRFQSKKYMFKVLTLIGVMIIQQ